MYKWEFESSCQIIGLSALWYVWMNGEWQVIIFHLVSTPIALIFWPLPLTAFDGLVVSTAAVRPKSVFPSGSGPLQHHYMAGAGPNGWNIDSFFDLEILYDWLVGCWLLVVGCFLRIYVALAVFQPYRDLEAGDNQYLKSYPWDRESNPGPLAPQAKSLPVTTTPPLLLYVWHHYVFRFCPFSVACALYNPEHKNEITPRLTNLIWYVSGEVRSMK